MSSLIVLAVFKGNWVMRDYFVTLAADVEFLGYFLLEWSESIAEVGENDDESEGEWEDGAQDLIDKDTEIENSARDLESRRRLDEFMNKVNLFKN